MQTFYYKMKALTAILCFVLCSYVQAQNGSITGIVKDATSKAVLADVRINIEGTEQVATSDGDGVFSFKNLSDGRKALFFSLDQYETLKLDVTVKDEKVLALGDVFLSINQSTDLIRPKTLFLRLPYQILIIKVLARKIFRAFYRLLVIFLFLRQLLHLALLVFASEATMPTKQVCI